MKKILTILAIIVLMSIVGQNVMAETDAMEIMKKSHLAYYYAADDGTAHVTMKIIKKGKERTREFTMLRLDLADGGEQKYYTYFKRPSDVSRLTFMVWKNPDANDKRWLYVPAVDLVKQISADDKNASFVGSNFTYEDVSGRHWSEDSHSLLSENETLDGKAVYLISSIPVEKYKGFAEKKSWIDKSSYLPLKEEYYDAKGKLTRVFSADKIETIDGIETVTLRTMENIKKKQKTTIAFEQINYNTGLTDDIFTERFLRTPPRKFIK
jgi:outer membrane lipoprotein-sorting protein